MIIIYSIYRINTDEFFAGFSEQGVPEWTPNMDKAITFVDKTTAMLEADSLSDDFHFAVRVVKCSW